MAELNFDDEEMQNETALPAAAIPPAGGFLKQRRNLIIVAVVAGVFILSALLFGLRLLGDSKPKSRQKPGAMTSSDIAKQSKLAAEKEEKEKEKKKKAQKKIKYVKLYDLPSTQAGDVLRELSFAEISFKTEQRGKNFIILVDQEEVTTALNLLATKGLPEGNAKGFALLDNTQTLGVTEFDKRIRYIRALAGELEKAIIQFEMIETAKVQIVLPEQRLFAATQPPVTASVLIRRQAGVILTDEIVFSIIQLVANSVENLQPENVSVIDTEGHVLSEGIFERMVLQEAGLAGRSGQTAPKVNVPTEEEPQLTEEEDPILDDTYLPSADNGGPVVPDYESIRQWYDIKEDYEKSLREKVSKQLSGILPPGSYKVAVTAELGPAGEGDVLDVRLITTSVVVDNAREDIFLDDELKQQIFNTVAGAVGYVKGRDSILLSRGDFTLLTPEERAEVIAQSTPKSKKSILDKIPSYMWYPLIPVFAVAAFFGLRRKRPVSKPTEEIDQTPLAEQENMDADFDNMKDEIADERRFSDLRDLADQDPAAIARMMENWLEEDNVNQEEPELEEVGV